MTRTRTRVAIAALAVAALAGCTGDGGEAEDTAEATTPAPAATTEAPTEEPGEPGEHVPITEPMERTWPEPVETVAGEGREFTLFGVHRIDDERVVVTGSIAGSYEGTAAGSWFEPGYFFATGGYEFSRIAVVDADGVRHLPVRDGEDHCLCSLSSQPYEDLTEPRAPAWVVLSAPADATTLDVEVTGVGTVENVPITELPAATSVPFGWEEVLSMDSVEREGGVLTARATIANVGDVDPSYLYSRHRFDYFDLASQHCFQGFAAWGGAEPTGRMAADPDCERGPLPAAGEQVTLEVKIADPGTGDLLILPDAGLPLTVESDGSPAPGAVESLRTYAARSEQGGATLTGGEQVSVDLDTSVLFDIDEATLTPAAKDALAIAVETLEAQESRSIVVAGHTDSVGSEEDNLTLSEQRAKAVAKALERELGGGWDVSVEWYGETRPAVDEGGDDEQVEAARARNRRVEITTD